MKQAVPSISPELRPHLAYREKPSFVLQLSALLSLVFIASVPLQSVRLFDLSLAIYAALVLALLAPFSFLSGNRRVPKLYLLDWMIIAYILLILPSVQDSEGLFLWFKGVLYLAGYLGLRFALHNIPDLDRFLARSALVGLTGIFLLVAVGIYMAGLSLEDLLRFDYWRVTLRIFEAIGGGGEENEYSGADVLRNTTSDSIVLLAGILLLQGRFAWPIAAALLVFMLQSRRATANFLYLFLVPQKYRRERLALLFVMILVGLALVLGGDALDFETRYSDFDETTRAVQFRAVIDQLPHTWSSGVGYGAVLYGSHVHNFILNSAYMSGLIPAALALAIFTMTGIHAIFGKGRYHHLAVIAIPHMLVAPTVGGVFPLQVWILFAIVLEGEQRFAQGREKPLEQTAKPDIAKLRQSTPRATHA